MDGRRIAALRIHRAGTRATAATVTSTQSASV
jgi:hypothetical protein